MGSPTISDLSSLESWFLSYRREFPWRLTTDPYAVWVSEVMLQQTQAAVVIPYFKRWMELFPTIQALAAAELDTILKVWEGLGYYSRARNLHAGARYVVERWQGKLPTDAESLSTIKGLGPYTVGAILSFAFHQKAPAVDGNVMRVLSRLFALEDDLAKPATLNKFRALTLRLLPDKEPWIMMEALIELGATICQRKAHCHECPLQASCLAHQRGIVHQLPYKSSKTKTEKLLRSVAVIQANDRYLVRRGSPGGVMADLYEFPYYPIENAASANSDLLRNIHDQFGISATIQKGLPSINHSFTKYQATLFPFLVVTADMYKLAEWEWLTLAQMQEKPFSSGHRRLLSLLVTR